MATLITASGFLFGVGMGGLFDGIVLHQLLQWHHMLSSWYPLTTIENVRINTRWDGIFHSATYVVVVLATYLLWRAAQTRPLQLSGRPLLGAALMGWGLFNLLEGAIDHYWLGLHHVNEQVAAAEQPWWDGGFLAGGALMLVIGVVVIRRGRSTPTPW